MPGYKYCDVSHLETELAQPAPWKSASTPEALAAATREASELARAAFEQGSARDAALVERILYRMHAKSAFGAPIAPVPATIWNALVTAKLRQLIPEPGEPASELDLDSMTQELERRVHLAGTHAHPFLDDLSNDAGLRGYRVFLKNWYAMASGLAEFLMAVAQRASPAMRGEIHENLSDELFSGTPHIDLRARVLEGAGTRFDEHTAIDDPEICTETLGLINWRAAASLLPNPCYALGLFYSIEANWHYESRRHLDALRKLRVPEDNLTSLALHVERDEDHASHWLAMIRSAVHSPADRACVVHGLTAEFVARKRMYDAMRRYVYGG